LDSQQPKTLIVIAGPTASGKTTLGITVANHFRTEILSADSRQVFKEINIGTAKPTPEELNQAKHHFVNHVSIHEEYSAGQFEREALLLLTNLFEVKDTVVLVGGSGLYIQAVCEGFDELPTISGGIRERLQKRVRDEGLESLVRELIDKDPEYAKQVDLANPQRLMRALEIIQQTGKTYSSFRVKKQIERPFTIKKFAIEWEREELYNRINQRVDAMIDQGLEEEARAFYPLKHLNALQTVGYSEWFSYFDGSIDREEAIRLIKRNTRRFAKRQLTWLRRDNSIVWVEPGEMKDIIDSKEV